MKILELRAQNIKNLKVVEIRPDGEAVVLEGKNGAGKSAVLDAIFSTLTGKRLKDAIRHGEDRAEVALDLGEIIVTRVWTGSGERLEVKNRDGFKSSSPQEVLNQKIGKLSFDPLSFKDMKEADQVDYLKKLLGLDFSDREEKIKEAYEARTISNRDAKSCDAAITKLIADEDLDPTELNNHVVGEEVGAATLIEEYNSLVEKNRRYSEVLDGRKHVEEEIKMLKEKIRQHEEWLESNPLPDPVSEEILLDAKKAIDCCEEKNRRVRVIKKYTELVSQKKSYVEDSEKYTKAIDDEKDFIEKAIREAKFPIEGLSITAAGVSYNGILLSRLSTGQQVKVSTAIAMALNPDLRVILIREGSLLDRDGFDSIVELAKEKDYQIWIEKVSDEKGAGIYIEDGSLKS